MANVSDQDTDYNTAVTAGGAAAAAAAAAPAAGGGGNEDSSVVLLLEQELEAARLSQSQLATMKLEVEVAHLAAQAAARAVR